MRALLLLFFAVGVEAAEVSGVVAFYLHDSGTFSPVAGARVELVETQLTAITDVAGRFVIEGVPAGMHSVRVGTQTARVRVRTSASVVRRRFTLWESGCWAHAGTVVDARTDEAIAGAVVNGAVSDENGHYFIPLFCSAVRPFGTSVWSIEAEGYRGVQFFARRESMLGIVDFALVPAAPKAPTRNPDP